MEQNQNQNKESLLSMLDDKLKSKVEQLKKEAEKYKGILIDSFTELLHNQDNFSKNNNVNVFLDYLLEYLTLYSRMEEVEKNISFSEEIDKIENQLNNAQEGPKANAQEGPKANAQEGPKANAQEMNVVEEENNNSKGDNNINSKKY